MSGDRDVKRPGRVATITALIILLSGTVFCCFVLAVLARWIAHATGVWPL